MTMHTDDWYSGKLGDTLASIQHRLTEREREIAHLDRTLDRVSQRVDVLEEYVDKMSKDAPSLSAERDHESGLERLLRGVERVSQWSQDYQGQPHAANDDTPSLPDGYRISVSNDARKVVMHEDGITEGDHLWVGAHSADTHRAIAAMHLKAAAILDELEEDARKDSDDMEGKVLAVKAYTNASDDALGSLKRSIRYLAERTQYDPVTITEDAVQLVKGEEMEMDELVARLTHRYTLYAYHRGTLQR